MQIQDRDPAIAVQQTHVRRDGIAVRGATVLAAHVGLAVPASLVQRYSHRVDVPCLHGGDDAWPAGPSQMPHPCTQAYSPPDRSTPRRTTRAPRALTSRLPETCRLGARRLRPRLPLGSAPPARSARCPGRPRTPLCTSRPRPGPAGRRSVLAASWDAVLTIRGIRGALESPYRIIPERKGSRGRFPIRHLPDDQPSSRPPAIFHTTSHPRGVSRPIYTLSSAYQMHADGERARVLPLIMGQRGSYTVPMTHDHGHHPCRIPPGGIPDRLAREALTGFVSLRPR